MVRLVSVAGTQANAFAVQPLFGKGEMVVHMTLKDAVEGNEYIIQQIETDDEELSAFLFSLGCYSGETITVVSHLKGGCIVSIKDGRYNIDNQLASAICI